MNAGSFEQKQNHRRVVGMRVDASSYSDATDLVIRAAQQRDPFWLCPASVHTAIEAHRSLDFARTMETASLVTTDGMPLVWSMRMLGIHGQTRVYGPTLTQHILDAAAKRRIPVGFYGGSPETLRKLLQTCAERWPELQIAYSFSPPYRPPTPEEDTATIARIRDSGARILFIGLGCPAQERWAQRHHRTLQMPVLAVGAAFDFIAGTRRQSPPFLQRLGLEWFFRLCTEPKRLWKRYLLGNPTFVMLLLAQLTGLRRFGPQDDPSAQD